MSSGDIDLSTLGAEELVTDPDTGLQHKAEDRPDLVTKVREPTGGEKRDDRPRGKPKMEIGEATLRLFTALDRLMPEGEGQLPLKIRSAMREAGDDYQFEQLVDHFPEFVKAAKTASEADPENGALKNTKARALRLKKRFPRALRKQLPQLLTQQDAEFEARKATETAQKAAKDAEVQARKDKQEGVRTFERNMGYFFLVFIFLVFFVVICALVRFAVFPGGASSSSTNSRYHDHDQNLHNLHTPKPVVAHGFEGTHYKPPPWSRKPGVESDTGS